uniref:Uncharacterized protein n=1 Tax=Amphora coffeiformis TaxID=265554 RepID=A0A7S3P6U6_9STRA
MDRPYPHGLDDGGRSRDNGRAHPSPNGRSALRNGNDAGHPPSPRLLYDSNGSPNNSFYHKPHNIIERGTSSPTSVAALYDLPLSRRPSLLYTHTDTNSRSSSRSASPDSLGYRNHDSRNDFHYHYNHEWRTSSSNLKLPPRTSPGAQWTSNANAISAATASNLLLTVPSSASLVQQHPILPNMMNNPALAYVEISPGVKVRLRGSQETKACIAQDFYIPTMCTSCRLDPLFCIMDANYVVCPVCRVVQPLEGGADMEYQGGVGLGFDFDTLLQWQTEARRQRQPLQQQQQQQQQASSSSPTAVAAAAATAAAPAPAPATSRW